LYQFASCEIAAAGGKRCGGSDGHGAGLSLSRAFSSAVAMAEMHIESINAVTLAVHDMSRSVRFYTALGFSVRYGGECAAFTSLHAGSCYLNLIAQPADRRWSW